MKGSGYRECLIFVVGSTPQIITETLWALVTRKPAVHPDEICMITTLTGRKKIEETLIGEDILDRFCDEYGLPRIAVTESSFVLITDS